MATHLDLAFRTQLTTRKRKLEDALTISPDREYLTDLLQEVDAALGRVESGTFGLCEVCHDPIESDRLAADPLARFCLDHLTPLQQRDLEQDLNLAAHIQSALLPKRDIVHSGWRAAYHYEPAGPVSGDYCDLVPVENGDLFFMLGDVSGKGVPASMLMAHLHALFHALIPVNLPLVQMVERASRVFCESTMANQYATLVCGKAGQQGEIELCNAGHLPPLWVRDSEIRSIEATGLPLGLFCSEKFSANKIRLNRGEQLVLFSDGLTETQNSMGAEFGVQPLMEMARKHRGSSARELVSAFSAKAENFRSDSPRRDDLTLLVLERMEG